MPITLQANVRNPYTETVVPMSLSSAPGAHHTVVGGDFSLDVNMRGTLDAGKPAIFDVVPDADTKEVRGVVEKGGGTSWVACVSGDPDDGGFAIRITIEGRADSSSEWLPIGMVAVLHLKDIPAALKPGAIVAPGDLLGVATDQFGGRCSGGPHLHVEAATPDGQTRPLVNRVGEAVDANAVFFSLTRILAGTGGSSGSPAQPSNPLAMPANLKEHYAAHGLGLPPVFVRAPIYAALGLAPDGHYEGSVEQNVALLAVLSRRGIAPVSDVGLTPE